MAGKVDEEIGFREWDRGRRGARATRRVRPAFAKTSLGETLRGRLDGYANVVAELGPPVLSGNSSLKFSHKSARLSTLKR